MSVTCDRSVVFYGYSGFLHKWNWQSRYNWNIVQNGVKYHPVYKGFGLDRFHILCLFLYYRCDQQVWTHFNTDFDLWTSQENSICVQSYLTYKKKCISIDFTKIINQKKNNYELYHNLGSKLSDKTCRCLFSLVIR